MVKDSVFISIMTIWLQPTWFDNYKVYCCVWVFSSRLDCIFLRDFALAFCDETSSNHPVHSVLLKYAQYTPVAVSMVGWGCILCCRNMQYYHSTVQYSTVHGTFLLELLRVTKALINTTHDTTLISHTVIFIDTQSCTQVSNVARHPQYNRLWPQKCNGHFELDQHC